MNESEQNEARNHFMHKFSVYFLPNTQFEQILYENVQFRRIRLCPAEIKVRLQSWTALDSPKQNARVINNNNEIFHSFFSIFTMNSFGLISFANFELQFKILILDFSNAILKLLNVNISVTQETGTTSVACIIKTYYDRKWWL